MLYKHPLYASYHRLVVAAVTPPLVHQNFKKNNQTESMKIAVIFLSLCGTWLGGQAMYTNTGQLYASMAGRDLADDVTRHQFDVRSKLDCALACVHAAYCGMFAVCRRDPLTYST